MPLRGRPALGPAMAGRCRPAAALRALVMTALWAGVLVQLWQQILHYQSQPTARLQFRQQQPLMPSFSLCPFQLDKAELKKLQIEQTEELLQTRDKDSMPLGLTRSAFKRFKWKLPLDQLWMRLGGLDKNKSNSVADILRTCDDGSDCLSAADMSADDDASATTGKWRLSLRLQGPCWTYRSGSSLTRDGLGVAMRGPYLELKNGADGKRTFELIVHGSQEMPSDPLVSRPPPETSLRLHSGYEYTVLVHGFVERNADLWRIPCNASEGASAQECRSRCVQRLVSEAAGCRGPWFQSDDIPLCDNATSWERLMKMRRFVTSDRADRACPCQRRCHNERYLVSAVQQPMESKKKTYMRFILREDMTEEVEAVTYTLSNLIAELGGNVGLLLGLSAAQLYDWLERGAAALHRRLTAHQRFTNPAGFPAAGTIRVLIQPAR